jgi:hypothetical protein
MEAVAQQGYDEESFAVALDDEREIIVNPSAYLSEAVSSDLSLKLAVDAEQWHRDVGGRAAAERLDFSAAKPASRSRRAISSSTRAPFRLVVSWHGGFAGSPRNPQFSPVDGGPGSAVQCGQARSATMRSRAELSASSSAGSSLGRVGHHPDAAIGRSRSR